ncbi:MAG: hypothetical protein AB7I34_19225 [Rhizobiaceae bacterium]
MTPNNEKAVDLALAKFADRVKTVLRNAPKGTTLEATLVLDDHGHFSMKWVGLGS